MTQELDPPSRSGFMLLVFTFMPEHVTSGLDFALFLALPLLRQILPFWATFLGWLETALWQCFFNATLVIEHTQHQDSACFSRHYCHKKRDRVGSVIKAKTLFLKQGWGKLWVILNQINGWTTGHCFPLPPLPSSSSDSQGCLVTNNPCCQQDGAPTAAMRTPIRKPVMGQSLPRLCWSRWEKLHNLGLAPPSPQPFPNILSVGCSIGDTTPNCPLPWAGICSIYVSSKRCLLRLCLLKEVLQGPCSDTACTLGAVGMSPLSSGPCNVLTLLSSNPNSCWCHYFNRDHWYLVIRDPIRHTPKLPLVVVTAAGKRRFPQCF